MPAGAAAPISMPSSAAASTTAIICCSPATARRSPISSAIGALDTLRAAGRGGDPVRRSGDRRALGGAAQSRRGAVVGAAARRGGCRAAGRAIISRRCGCARAGAGDTVAAACSIRDSVAVPPVVGAARGRRAQHRRRGRRRPGCSGGSCARRSGRAPRPAGRCCRARGCRKAWSIRRSRMLRARGAEIRFGARLRALGFADGSRRELGFDGGTRRARPRATASILAVPAAIAARLVPGPRRARRLRADRQCALPRSTAPPDAPLFVGVIGGTAEWVFRKREVLSVTVSAADRLVDRPAEELREHAVARCRRSPSALPPQPGSAGAHRQGAARDVSRHAGAAARAGRRPRRAGTIFALPAIMSIPACPPRSKALFAPALPRPRRCASAASVAGGD